MYKRVSVDDVYRAPCRECTRSCVGIDDCAAFRAWMWVIWPMVTEPFRELQKAGGESDDKSSADK